MTWFKRHLNWTLFLTILVTAILTTIINDYFYFPFRLLIIPVLIFGIVVAIWYLRQKNRNLWWYFGTFLICAAGAGQSYNTSGLVGIFTVFISIPSLVILCLKNKRETKVT